MNAKLELRIIELLGKYGHLTNGIITQSCKSTKGINKRDVIKALNKLTLLNVVKLEEHSHIKNGRTVQRYTLTGKRYEPQKNVDNIKRIELLTKDLEQAVDRVKMLSNQLKELL